MSSSSDSCHCIIDTPGGHRMGILPLLDILPHEEFDPANSQKLLPHLATDGKQRHPIIVAHHPDGERYIQLDGANRHHCLGQLGYNYALAQVVDLADSHCIGLDRWHHAIKLDAATFLDSIAQTSFPERQASLEELPALLEEGATGCVFVFPEFVYAVSTQSLDALREVVGLYSTQGIQRVTPTQIVTLGGPAASLAVLKVQGYQGLVVFNPITPQQLLCTVAGSGLLPPGVSRFLITQGPSAQR
jgi:hypothetical protein